MLKFTISDSLNAYAEKKARKKMGNFYHILIVACKCLKNKISAVHRSHWRH